MASPSHPRWTIVANSAITRAPPTSRAVTAAMGVQPASINGFANGPDIAKLKAEPIALATPRWKLSLLPIAYLRRVGWLSVSAPGVLSAPTDLPAVARWCLPGDQPARRMNCDSTDWGTPACCACLE